MRDALVEFAYRSGWSLVRRMPEGVAASLFQRLADRTWRANGGGVRQLRENLRRVTDGRLNEEELELLVRDGMRSYLRYWMEAFRLPTLSQQDVLRRFEMHGFEPVAKASRAGRGSVVALPHSGNWDLAGAWVGAQGLQLSTVAERLKPEGVFQRFLDYRRELGMNIIPLTGGARSPQTELADCLAKGDVVALVADRNLSSGGVEVDFFGHKALFPSGPALLAARANVPLYAAHIFYAEDRAVCYLSEEIPVAGPGRLRQRVATATQQVADHFARGIAEHPQDWHMLQRFWPDLNVRAMERMSARGDQTGAHTEAAPGSTDAPGSFPLSEDSSDQGSQERPVRDNTADENGSTNTGRTTEDLT
ncbi:phosphatidylinositol mannoside acyltransferase [Natronoglycomyces albus]|uniref:Phosphatidylinositol mannoside acyltransferase n=1 Tax=Natronoglycomyces albus TaxID=2811108 RepID=A0A895XGL8_9ACTN|nr:phosphatidylinositol mannoside acyltransferase [Natronoglycomyces albus]QSB04027.1 phosphatidylinositol mannoside acyltransferase [Natronoglycomyces albus]